MFPLYVSKLNKNFKWFWQHPKRATSLHYTDDIWYNKVRVGHQPLENFMSKLSKEAQLSKRYTNHSIRSSVIGILEDEYEGRHVIGLSRHKNENTIKQYARRLSAKKKREMSATLTDTIQPKRQAKSPDRKFQFKASTTTATISKPPQPEAEKKNEDNIQFDLEAMDNAPPDDILINFLSQFDPVTENPPVNLPKLVPQQPPPMQQPQIQALQPSNTMNINKVSNVQNNVSANKPALPNMYFGGHSSVAKNYNFTPPK